MKLSNNVPNSSVRTRRILQASTALPLLLAAWPAAAEPIMQNSSGDIVVDQKEASGGNVTVNAGGVSLLGEGPVNPDGFIYPDVMVANSDGGSQLRSAAI